MGSGSRITGIGEYQRPVGIAGTRDCLAAGEVKPHGTGVTDRIATTVLDINNMRDVALRAHQHAWISRNTVAEWRTWRAELAAMIKMRCVNGQVIDIVKTVAVVVITTSAQPVVRRDAQVGVDIQELRFQVTTEDAVQVQWNLAINTIEAGGFDVEEVFTGDWIARIWIHERPVRVIIRARPGRAGIKVKIESSRYAERVATAIFDRHDMSDVTQRADHQAWIGHETVTERRSWRASLRGAAMVDMGIVYRRVGCRYRAIAIIVVARGHIEPVVREDTLAVVDVKEASRQRATDGAVDVQRYLAVNAVKTARLDIPEVLACGWVTRIRRNNRPGRISVWARLGRASSEVKVGAGHVTNRIAAAILDRGNVSDITQWANYQAGVSSNAVAERRTRGTRLLIAAVIQMSIVDRHVSRRNRAVAVIVVAWCHTEPIIREDALAVVNVQKARREHTAEGTINEQRQLTVDAIETAGLDVPKVLTSCWITRIRRHDRPGRIYIGTRFRWAIGEVEVSPGHITYRIATAVLNYDNVRDIT